MGNLIEQAAIKLKSRQLVGADSGGDKNAQAATRSSFCLDASIETQATECTSRSPGRRSPNSIICPTSIGKSRFPSNYVELNLSALARAGYGYLPGTRQTDEFRVIKRPLIRNAMGRGAAAIPNGNLIMVTSALSGEGKTFCAINVAMNIAAEVNNTVLLVDADVVRPSVCQVLGLQPQAGLLDVLQDESSDLSKVLIKTNVEKLSLLPSGSPCERATELLASDAMADLLDEMARRYPDRIIVFDSPPLLLTTEAQVLASHMGQIVMVVEAERTLQSEFEHALATIEGCPVKFMVLNRARMARCQGGYGYA